MKSTDPVVGQQAEQTFFADPAIDRLVGMVFALTAEVHVMRDRLALLEDALKQRGIDLAALDNAIPDGALEAKIAADRTALVQHILEGLPWPPRFEKLMAALTLFRSRDANAFHELVMEVRTWWAVQLFPRLREEYEVRRKLAAQEGRRIETPEDVALLFSNSTLYAYFCWLERHVQKSKYSSSRWGLVAQIAREPQTAAGRLQAGGALELDPKLGVPDYYAAHDIHQHPGNLHGDANAGLVYEASALSIHPKTKKNELHERFVALVRREGEFSRVLDMGCGFGKSTVPLAHAFPRAEVIGVDVSEPCLKLAAADAKDLPNVSFRQADARHTGLKEKFDLVTSTMLLHELPEESVDATLAETRRLLEPGGVSIHLDFRTEDPFWQFVMYGHGRRNNEPFLEPLIRMDLAAAYRKAGFEDVRIEPFAEREGATDPSNPFWRFPWAAIIARKPA